MREMLDENRPHALAPLLVGHEVLTVQECGWAGLKNGVLLREARARIDAFLTMDADLEYQQHLIGTPFGVVGLHAPSNRLADLRPVLSLARGALEDLLPGDVRHVDALHGLHPTGARAIVRAGG